jgi:hypothetical protein
MIYDKHQAGDLLKQRIKQEPPSEDYIYIYII